MMERKVEVCGLFINYKNCKSYMLCRKLHLFATPTLSACSSASDAKGVGPYGRLQPKQSSNRYPKLFLKSTLPVCLPVLGSTRRATQRESALAGNCNLREARTWRSVGLHLFSFLFLFFFFSFSFLFGFLVAKFLPSPSQNSKCIKWVSRRKVGSCHVVSSGCGSWSLATSA
jgi:hypothetical protein